MDKSPFEECNTIVLYLEPILNTYHQNYMNVLTLSSIPNGPLRELVYAISPEKLSPFQVSSWQCSPSCTYVLGRYRNRKPTMNTVNTFMYANDIPSVISFLRANGYTIDTNITDLLNQSNVNMTNNCTNGGKKAMICVFSFMNVL
jgi:hypothetical protein